MDATPTKAGRREWLGLAVLALPAALISMDLTVLHLAVPELSTDLHPTSAELLWIVDIYGFLIAGFLLPMGTLGDRLGRRRLLLLGAGAFTLASVGAAFATSPEMLIAMRALMGVAGATLMPSTMALIRNMFRDPAQRTQAISIWMLGFMVGGGLGPLVGGALLEWFDWGAVFLLAVPVMAMLLVAGPLLLPEYRNESAGRFDLASAGLSLVAVLGVVYGVKHGAEDGFDVVSALTIAGGALVGAAFVHRQRRIDEPLVDVGLFANRAFSLALVTNVVSFLVMMGIFLFVAQYLQLVRGLSPLEAGLWLLPQTAAATLGSLAAPALGRRIRPAFLVAAGLTVGALGFLMLLGVNDRGDLGLLIASSVVTSVGIVPVFAVAADLVLAAAPAEHAGAASGMSETGTELGGALGIAILGSVATAVYRNELGTSAPEPARDTLAGAVDVAAALPPEAASALLDAAQGAFLSGMQAAAVISAVLALALAAGAAALLREVRSAAEAVPVPA